MRSRHWYTSLANRLCSGLSNRRSVCQGRIPAQQMSPHPMADRLRAPFPWFGGKSMVADAVWERFGDVASFVEPFFGSGAVLLGRPDGAHGVETVNDLDGFVANFWRSCAHSPTETWVWADSPVNEVDLHARHVWLIVHHDGGFTAAGSSTGAPSHGSNVVAGRRRIRDCGTAPRARG